MAPDRARPTFAAALTWAVALASLGYAALRAPATEDSQAPAAAPAPAQVEPPVPVTAQGIDRALSLVPPLALGPVEADLFHPDHAPGPDGVRSPAPPPAYGGRAVVHLEGMPASLNYAIETSGHARRILFEVHETLLREDWETGEWKPLLARAWQAEDLLVLRGGDPRTGEKVIVGELEDRGDSWRIVGRLGDAAPGSTSAKIDATLEKENALAAERGCVFTFRLRDDVRWHDGHPFDAWDVWWSWKVYRLEGVDTGAKRSQFEKVVRAEVLDAHTIRFTYERQYFRALKLLGDMTIVPRHLYDLTDPDNAAADPEYHERRRREDPAWKPDAKEIAAYFTQNPHNRSWVGLGPYRVTRWDASGVEAERFAGYFDPADGGYLDAIRWRLVPDDAAAFQALKNGELDYAQRLSAEDYFGAATSQPPFTERCYKGAFDSTAYSYIAWNLHHPKFQDVRVRRALAHAFDAEGFRKTYYRGYARQVTGHFPMATAAYDHAVAPLAHAPDVASDLLLEAGWYDRDGDGVVDKDGVPLSIELLIVSGNQAGVQLGARYQQDLARIGVRLEPRELELAAVSARARSKDFEAVSLAWVLPLESDPEQVWHSKNGAKDARSSNYAGLVDPEVDRLIEEGQRELDPAARAAVWRRLHARLYELQPYLWLYSPMRKFAASRSLRGIQCVPLDPNYVIRRWYHPAGTPGTRATRG